MLAPNGDHRSPGGVISAFCERKTTTSDAPGVGLERDGAEARDGVDNA